MTSASTPPVGPEPLRPLAGVRVLDLADRSGAVAGRVLADLGAEVILVEPASGNTIRRLAPFLDDAPRIERSFAHQYWSANKASVVLDLEEDDDREHFVQLCRSAHALIDTFRPGMLDSLGLGHQSLRGANPSLIQCSITPFGLHSPWRDRSATDIVAGAAGGLLAVSGESRGVPVQGGADVSYTMAGLVAASSVSIALHRAAATPEAGGVHIDVSLQEATVMAVMQTANASHWVWHGRIPRRPGLSSALKCADGGYVGHLVRPDRFGAFLDWADREGIDHGMTPDDWRWSRLDAPRKDNPVNETTLALAAKLTRDEFAAGALEADLVCLPVLGFADMETHEQYVVNDQFWQMPNDALGVEVGMVRSPVDGFADPVPIARAPMLGEHQHLIDALPSSQMTTQVPDTVARTADKADPAAALAGLRIVDLTWVLAGPIGTRLLASFGAEVIRVESPKKPDSMRSNPGPDGQPDPDMAGLFNTVNAGKKSFAVDLGTEAGLGLLKELITTADVVVNNFRPGAMDRMGLGFDVLKGLKSDIVSLSLPGAHPKGPWGVRPSMGNILMAASGFNMLTGFEGERPRGIGIAYPDFTAPHLLVSSLLAGVRRRNATGDPQEIQLTQLMGTIALLGAEWMQYSVTGEQPPRRSNRDPNLCPHGVYPAAPDGERDRWVALAVADDAQFASLCGVIDRRELVSDARFVDHASRKANEDVLDEIVSAWTAARDSWELADLLQAQGIAAAVVEDLRDTYERDPQLPSHYQIVHQPVQPTVDIPIDREAARWNSEAHDLVRSPGVGEHNEYVVKGLLSRSDDEYVQLIVDEVLN